MRFGVKILVLFLVIVLFLLAIPAVLHVYNSNSSTIPEKSNDSVRIASYNIHYIVGGEDQGRWGEENWEKRKIALSSVISDLNADLIAFQESETWDRGGSYTTQRNLAVDWILAQHSDYNAGAVSDDPSQFPITQPIFYNKELFVLLDQGWFFFSETPDVIYSRTFNGSFPAFASWIQLERINDQKQFRIVNIHTDYQNGSNRIKTAKLVSDRIEPWLSSGESVFVVGDFNAWASSKSMSMYQEANIDFVPLKGSSYHIDIGVHLFGSIDHIGYTQGLSFVEDSSFIYQHKRTYPFPSDHYPIAADFNLD